ncbi:MAG: ABC transporter substrate-binding protein [Suipraeoptans sp.]
MKKRFKVLSILLIFTMVVSIFAACGANDENSNESSSEGSVEGEVDSGEEYTIHYLTAKSKEEGAVKAIEKVAAMYKEENPHFNFEVESIADRTAYLQKLKILASSDELPEMFDSDADSFFQELANAGQVADVDKLYEDLDIVDTIYENARNYQRMENDFLGLICWQANTEYFWYNKTCFENAGITETPKTFEEFFEVCEKLKSADTTPIALAGADSWPLLRYIAMIPFRETGNTYIQKAIKGEESFGSETGIEAAEFIVELAPYFQTGWNTADMATAVGLVTSGEAAIVYDGTWELPMFLNEDKTVKEDIGYFTLPTVGANDVTTMSDYWAHAGIGTAIRADAMDDNMMDFMKFVFENYADISLYDFDILPGMKTTVRDNTPAIYEELMENYSGVKDFAVCWDVVIDSASNEVLVRETPNLAAGNITPEEWASRMDEAIKQNVN